ncbi:MAG: DUF501 domain-containing protein [Planctomycetota bacterium]
MSTHEHGIRLVHDDVTSEVEVRCPAGHPLVLKCHPLRRGKGRFEPFPTLWWLVCPRVVEAISRLEHAGYIHRFEERLAAEPDARTAHGADHDAYIAERWSLLSDDERRQIEARGLAASLSERGIGGIRDRRRLKCLHLHYAHHLARGSVIGRWIDELGAVVPCAGS